MQQDKHVVVLGGGVVGLTTAAALVRSSDHVHVTVVERNQSVAADTSFANAGRVCPTRMMSYPLSNPQMLATVVKAPFNIIRARLRSLTTGNVASTDPADIDFPSNVTLTPRLVRWGCHYILNSSWARFHRNNQTFQELAVHSMEELRGLLGVSVHSNDDLFAQFDLRRGNLVLYGSQESLRHGQHVLDVARSVGFHDNHVFGDLAASRREFSFLSDDWMTRRYANGGANLLLGDDFSLNTYKLCQSIAGRLEKHPRARLATGTSATRIQLDASGTQATGVELADGRVVAADAVVVCCGNETKSFVERQFSVYLPIEPAQGHTLELHGVKDGPPMCVVDAESGKLSYQATPLGKDILRVGGFAAFVGIPPEEARSSEEAESEAILVRYTKQLFPHMSWTSSAKVWTGYRPSTPDFLPIVDAMPTCTNVVVNCGHGGLGLNLAPGTSTVAASIVQRALFDDEPVDLLPGLPGKLRLDRFGMVGYLKDMFQW